MNMIATTPFGRRPMTATLVKRVQEARAPVQVTDIDKWALFRDLCTARHAFDITDRDLAVLNALLSFHQPKILSQADNLVVFPSNRKLAERAHGMAESTLRRHLAALNNAGLIQRHDSPNGKRYAARGQGGQIVRAFGFDLRPLLIHAKDIAYAAAEAHAAAERIRRVREDVVILKRDAIKLCQYAQDIGASGDWTSVEATLLTIHKQMRRKLDAPTLETLRATLKPLLKQIISHIETAETSGTDSQNERHYQNSHKDSSVFEPCNEKDKIEVAEQPKAQTPSLPLSLVLKACPDILPYSQNGISHWRDLINLAEFVRGMMGISPDAWKKAVRVMGAEIAAITVASILQRITEIKNPGGYLRALTQKADTGAFSPGPMVMALLNKC